MFIMGTKHHADSAYVKKNGVASLETIEFTNYDIPAHITIARLDVNITP